MNQSTMNLMWIYLVMIIAVVGLSDGQDNETTTTTTTTFPTAVSMEMSLNMSSDIPPDNQKNPSLQVSGADLRKGLADLLRKLDAKHPIRKLIGHCRKTIKEKIAHIRLRRKLIMEHCYNDTFDGRRMNIFQVSIFKVIEKYFTVIRAPKIDLNRSYQHILNFVANLKQLILDIVECAYHHEKRFGLMGVTSLAHLSDDEFNSMLNNQLSSLNFSDPIETGSELNFQSDDGNFGAYSIPEEYDARDYGLVTRVQNQGVCGSCFIFAAVANVECAYLKLYQGELSPEEVDLSEQAMLDCADYHACHVGGKPWKVWLEMRWNRLIVDEEDRPYTGVQSYCDVYLPRSRHQFDVIGHKVFPASRQESIQRRILEYGPMVAAICADIRIKVLLGKYRGTDCCNRINHAITIVGWNREDWIIKNSWGLNHGVDGFLYLPRYPSNLCGIQRMSATAFVN